MSGIEVFTPLVRAVAVDGVSIVVGPMKARQFAQVQIAMRPVLQWLTKDADALVSDGLDDLVRLLAAATGQSPEWLEQRDPEALLGLLSEVVEVNADFSRRRMKPAWDRLAKMIAGVMDGAQSSLPLEG